MSPLVNVFEYLITQSQSISRGHGTAAVEQPQATLDLLVPIQPRRAWTAEDSRRKKLEEDPDAYDVTPHSVTCAGCHRPIRLNGTGRYYAANWNKHKMGCKNTHASNSNAARSMVSHLNFLCDIYIQFYLTQIFRSRNLMAALLRFASPSHPTASILKCGPPRRPQLREGRLFRRLIPAKLPPPSRAASTFIPLPQPLLQSRIPRPVTPQSISNAGATPIFSTDATLRRGRSSVHPVSRGRIHALVPRRLQDGILSRPAHAPRRALEPYERK